jgi:hypothetical protein
MTRMSDAAEPWYQSGLSFACTGCGGCCSGFPGFVWVTDEELAAIADYVGDAVGAVRLLRTLPVSGRTSLTEYANGDCTFFDSRTRRCTIYPVRPAQCRTWPFWRSNLASPAKWSETAAGCPGIGQGPVIPVEEIERLAAHPVL